jgi:transcription elongation factor Elf1
MFECARCGSSYSSQHIGVEHCPRCRLRDKVESPLAFKAFDLSSLNPPARVARSRHDGSQPPAPARPA